MLSAIKGGHLSTVVFLVQHGANVYDKYIDGISALEVAKAHPEIARIIKSSQEEIEKEELKNALTLYSNNRYDKALPLFYSLAQRNVTFAKQKLDEIMKNPKREECNILIALFNQYLKQDPDNRDYQFSLAELNAHLAQLTLSYEHAKLACETAKGLYSKVLINNPADMKAEEGLNKIKHIRKVLRQRQREMKNEQQKDQVVQEVGELAKLVESDSLPHATLERRFSTLEIKASTFKSVEFFVTRGDFYFELAKDEKNMVEKNIFYNKSIADYRCALEINPFNPHKESLTKRIQEINTIIQKINPPLSQGDARLFKPVTRQPSPIRTTTQTRSPTPRRAAPSHIIETDLHRKNLGGGK